MTIILDWRRLSIGPLRPCVLCGRPALMRNENYDPCHKVTKEARSNVRLQRRSFRLIWLSPLLGLPGYQPQTAGIEAALPYIDDFLPAHNLASLADLAVRLTHLEQRRPVRRAQVQGSRFKVQSGSLPL